MGAHSAGVGGVKFHKAVNFVAVGGRRDVVAVLAVFEVCLFAESEACVRGELLVLRVMRMLGRS